jgi:hypothetical protein
MLTLGSHNEEGYSVDYCSMSILDIEPNRDFVSDPNARKAADRGQQQ